MITRMQHVHDLNCQNNHQAAARFAWRNSDAQLQILATIDHVFDYMIDCVLVHAGAVGDYLAHFATHAADKAGSGWFGTVPRVVRENPPQVPVVNGGPIKVVTLALAPVVFAQCDAYFGKWFDFRACAIARFGAGELSHQAVDVFKLS